MVDSKQPWNTLGYVEQCFVASKATMNASALGADGNNVKLSDCAIDTTKISTLGEYLAERKRKEKPMDGQGWDDSLKDDPNLARCFVIPVTLPNGQEIEVIVNSKGQDMACMYRDEEGNKNEFQLTPRMRREIENNTPDNLKEVVGEEVYNKQFLPDNIEDFAEKVSKKELVPQSKKHAAKIAGITTEELETGIEEAENAEAEIPPEARDKIVQICSEQGLDIRNLKEVMEVQPEVIEDNLENTGIKQNKGKVYCLRFKDAGRQQGRVVMVQGEHVVDNERYDDYMNDFMNEHRGEKHVSVEEAEEKEGKISYTDLDGNTTVCEITKQPRDLNPSEKALLQEEMEKLDRAKEQILSSDMPLEDKTAQIIKINSKRIDLFKEYGIEVPTVENEVRADIEISEEVQKYDIEDEKLENSVSSEQIEDDEPEAFEVPGKRKRE